jgi:hypothetical protein
LEKLFRQKRELGNGEYATMTNAQIEQKAKNIATKSRGGRKTKRRRSKKHRRTLKRK